MVDKYLWLEDLEDPRTRRFIETHNKKLREFLGNLPDALVGEILEWYGVEYVYGYNACSNYVYVILRDRSGFRIVEWPSRSEVFSRRGAVITGVYPSSDCSKLGVSYTVGSDKSIIEIRGTDGTVLDRLEGYIYGIYWVGDKSYYYVRMFRHMPPPDGGDYPAMRVYLRSLEGSEKLAWGTGLRDGELLSLHPVYEEHMMLALVSKG